MPTPLEEIRAQLACHDTTVVTALARRALCGRAPDGFYTGKAQKMAMTRALPVGEMTPYIDKIVNGYTTTVVPALEPPATGLPGNCDALSAADATALNAIAARLQLSLQVAACKLNGRDATLRQAAAQADTAAIEALITYPSVEQLVLLRVRSRTADFMRTHNTPAALASRLPDTLHNIYATWLIPLSRAMQAAWLVGAAAAESK